MNQPMDDNLLGYLLDGLDDAETRQVEAELHASPGARRRLGQLKQALRPLEVDREEIALPPDLATRTLAKIAEQTGSGLPAAPRVPGAAGGSVEWWRRADVLVASCLFLLVVGIAAPLIYRWHSQRGMIECQENLRQFFVALASYRDQHGGYPDLSKQAPRNVAGAVVPVLADAGVLSPSFSVRCPAIGSRLGCTLTMPELIAMSDQDFQVEAPNLSLCYAFALGYRGPDGDLHGPWQAPASAWPILADRPLSGGSPGNSPNHGGTGQNVLFLDGHIRFVPGRIVGDPDDDIFLNRANTVAAGLDNRDVVLGSSAELP
jgi:prepilin-type processing-associated H-X9-DG protein